MEAIGNGQTAVKIPTRYLLNGVSDPRRANRLFRCLFFDRLEFNPGDMAYVHAVANTLCADDNVEFRMTGYYHRRNGFPDHEIEEINQTCKAFVCPLADMFSENWIWYVKSLTSLIRKLRIPCIVPCVGARCLPDGVSPKSAPFAKDVVSFVAAVLDKSSAIGVRGETTARFLSGLGFVRDRHFKVLGCPTAYARGKQLPVRPLKPDLSSGSCAFSLNVRAPESDWFFVDAMAGRFGRSTFVSQDVREFYCFMFTNGRWAPSVFDENPAYKRLLTEYARQDRMRFFLNRKPWSDFLSQTDFSIGQRIHGALLAILQGTPAVVVPFESRTRELAEFHGIPIVERTDRAGDPARILGELDYSSIQARQNENFPRYLRFFAENGIKTIFDDETSDRKVFPLERIIPTVFPDDAIHAWGHHGRLERFKIQAIRYAVQAKRKLKSRS